MCWQCICLERDNRGPVGMYSVGPVALPDGHQDFCVAGNISLSPSVLLGIHSFREQVGKFA